MSDALKQVIDLATELTDDPAKLRQFMETSLPRYSYPSAVTTGAPATQTPISVSPTTKPTPPERTRAADDPETVTVYVRKGSTNDERWLSFNVPARLDSFELLSMGVALDGNQGIFSVSKGAAVDWVSKEDGTVMPSYAYPTFVEVEEAFALNPAWATCSTLPDALREAELGLAKFLKSRGFSVAFR